MFAIEVLPQVQISKCFYDPDEVMRTYDEDSQKVCVMYVAGVDCL